MTSEISTFADDQLDAIGDYRVLSTASVISVIVSVFSVLGLLFPALIVLSLAGAVLGIIGLVRIRARPDELTGKIPATLGIAIGSLLFVGGITHHVYEYATEVPQGYQRIFWSDLAPDRSRPDLEVSPKSLELHNEKVFIKGYVHPGVSGQGKIQHFVLVPDMKTCCFGGQPKLTDMIEVTLPDPLSISYSTYRRKLAGVLTVTPKISKVGDIQAGYYKLKRVTSNENTFGTGTGLCRAAGRWMRAAGRFSTNIRSAFYRRFT